MLVAALAVGACQPAPANPIAPPSATRPSFTATAPVTPSPAFTATVPATPTPSYPYEVPLGEVNFSLIWRDSLDVDARTGQIGYVTGKGTQAYVQINDQTSLSYDDILPAGFHGGIYYSIAYSGDKQMLLTGTQEGPAYDDIIDIEWCGSEGRMGYAARRGDQAMVVLDGAEGKPYDSIPSDGLSGLYFSPDCQHLAYAAVQADRSFLVLDGQEGQAYDTIDEDTITFSPDGQHLAFYSKQGGRDLVVWDGRETTVQGRADQFAFSPDSSRLAYRLDLDGNVVDGRPGPRYQRIAFGVQFSPDSQHYAYVGSDQAGDVMVLDGVPGKHYENIDMDWYFDPDTQLPVFLAEQDGKQMWFTDGKSFGPAFENICGMCVATDADGVVVAYSAEQDGKELIVTRGVEGRRYAGVSSPSYFPEGDHVAYRAVDGNTVFVVVDEYEGLKTFDRVFVDEYGGSWIEFDSPDTFHYLASRGNQIYMVYEKLP
jgi:hypothetical protein